MVVLANTKQKQIMENNEMSQSMQTGGNPLDTPEVLGSAPLDAPISSGLGSGHELIGAPTVFPPVNITFHKAMLCLNEGGRATRKSWPEGTWIALVHGDNWTIYHPPFKFVSDPEPPDYCDPFVCRLDEKRHVGPWTPSQDDLMASDWTHFQNEEVEG